jgi:putative PIN family toxin of toxin-antitoxin system
MMGQRAAVFDCNVFLQAMLSANGAVHACRQHVLADDVTLYFSPFVLAEVRKLPSHKKLRRLSRFTAERVERFIEELLSVGELVSDPSPNFAYPRDPDDARYVDLAIATGSFLVVSSDKDLLDLMDDSNSEGKRLRSSHASFLVVTPSQFLTTLRSNPL